MLQSVKDEKTRVRCTDGGEDVLDGLADLKSSESIKHVVIMQYQCSRVTVCPSTGYTH